MPIELTLEQRKADSEKRLKEFQEEYKKLVDKYQIDISAEVKPVMGFMDLKYQKQ